MLHASINKAPTITRWGWPVTYEPREFVTLPGLLGVTRGIVPESYLHENKDPFYATFKALVAYDIRYDNPKCPRGDSLVAWATVTENEPGFYRELYEMKGIKPGDLVAKLSSFVPYGAGQQHLKGQFERNGTGSKVLELLEADAREHGCIAMATGIISTREMENFMRKKSAYVGDPEFRFFVRRLD